MFTIFQNEHKHQTWSQNSPQNKSWQCKILSVERMFTVPTQYVQVFYQPIFIRVYLLSSVGLHGVSKYRRVK